MELRIALMLMEDGSQAVVRGSPGKVQALFDHASKKAGGGRIPHQVYGEVWSAAQEDDLWRTFAEGCHQGGFGEMAEEKYWIWRRKAANIWRLPDRSATCIFMAGSKEMLVQL